MVADHRHAAWSPRSASGIDENWPALVAGRSGIKRITRFPTEHLRTTIAGTIDYHRTSDTPGPQARAGDTRRRRSDRAMAGIGTPGDFPGPLFTAIPPVEIGLAVARRRLYDAGDPQIADAYDRMMRRGRGPERPLAVRARHATAIVAERLADRFGTKGAPISLTTACASGATAIQLGVEAIRRGDTERRSASAPTAR